MQTLELPLEMPPQKIVAAPPVTSGRHGFRLHPGLDPSKYEMPGSLAHVGSWKAFCYVGNNCGDDDKVQTMHKVGYVMISLVDDTIVPIARGDEHHRGYDLLHDLASGEYLNYGVSPSRHRKRLPRIDLNARQYVPVWSYGTNYVYGPEDVRDMTVALRKWLSYGGRDGIVVGANDLNGKALSSRQMVERNGDFTVTPGTLAPIGAEILARFERISSDLVTLGRHPARPAMTDTFGRVSDLLTYIEPLCYQLGIDYDWYKQAPQRLKEVRRSADSQALWEFVFGFSGLKNVIHANLRKDAEDKSNWRRDSIQSVWGDIGLAIDMLGRL